MKITTPEHSGMKILVAICFRNHPCAKLVCFFNPWDRMDGGRSACLVGGTTLILHLIQHSMT